jgi:hypothetical protein
MKTQRWNCGMMRRYRFPNGATLVCTTGKEPARIIPTWCAHISEAMARNEAAAALVQLRQINKKPPAFPTVQHAMDARARNGESK